MRTLLAILLVAMNCAAESQLFKWLPSPSAADGYILWHRVPDALPEGFSVGLATNYVYSGKMADGQNWFSLTAWHSTTTGLEMSVFSNEVCITNTPAVSIDTVVEFSTNLNDGWQPAQTNHFIILPTLPASFYRQGGIVIHRTNVISYPNP